MDAAGFRDFARLMTGTSTQIVEDVMIAAAALREGGQAGRRRRQAYPTDRILAAGSR